MSGLSAVSPLNVGEVSFTENHDRTDHFTRSPVISLPSVRPEPTVKGISKQSLTKVFLNAFIK